MGRNCCLMVSLLALAAVASPAQAQVGSEPVIAAWAAEAPPSPPAGAMANYTVPARDDDGAFLTPSHGVTPEEAVWHVRAALNVAALSCRDTAEGSTVAAYNTLLRERDAALAAAYAGMTAQYRVRFGDAAQGRSDSDMTRVYNYYAQPPVHDRFCATARAVLAEAPTVQPADFGAFAMAALARLETPFTDFYQQYDGYRVALANWRMAHTPVTRAAPVQMANAVQQSAVLTVVAQQTSPATPPVVGTAPQPQSVAVLQIASQ